MDFYESEHTKFMRELFSKRPDLIEKQKEARAIWWDKEVDREALKRYREDKVPQKGYVYFTWPNRDEKSQRKEVEE